MGMTQNIGVCSKRAARKEKKKRGGTDHGSPDDAITGHTHGDVRHVRRSVPPVVDGPEEVLVVLGSKKEATSRLRQKEVPVWLDLDQ